MSWDDFRYLLAVDRVGSLSAAARLLRVDQTTIGRRLDALESRMGTQLVERGAGGCQLTPAGRRASAAAQAMDAATQALDLEIARQDIGVEGTVRIAAPGGFVPVLAPALAELRNRHPLLQFELDSTPTLHNLVRREADLAIRMTSDMQPSLIATRLGDIVWGLFASEGYLARRGMPAVLDGHDVIGFFDPLTRTPGGRWLAGHATAARVVLEADHMNTALQCAAAGLGVTAAPCFMAQAHPTLRGAWPEPIARTPFFLVTHADVADVPRVRATIDHLTRYVRALAEFQPAAL